MAALRCLSNGKPMVTRFACLRPRFKFAGETITVAGRLSAVNPAVALDKFAEIFCAAGAAALVLAVVLIALLWFICETERSRSRGRRRSH
jgi:hypothetical protein